MIPLGDLGVREPMWTGLSYDVGNGVVYRNNSSCSVIVRVSVVLKRTVGDSD